MKHLIFAALLLVPAIASADRGHDDHDRGHEHDRPAGHDDDHDDGHHHQVHPVRAVAPPAPRYEVPPPAPSPRHQWIAGYWAWSAGKTVWVAGHWALPPAPGYAWEPARWENAGGNWEFYAGHWRAVETPEPSVVYQPVAPPVQEVVVQAEPPPPVAEVQGAIPFAGAIWIPGNWHWNGARYVWVAGRWSAHPAGWSWEPDHWERRPDGRWVERAGYWKH